MWRTIQSWTDSAEGRLFHMSENKRGRARGRKVNEPGGKIEAQRVGLGDCKFAGGRLE